jgi:hypothetical protein
MAVTLSKEILHDINDGRKKTMRNDAIPSQAFVGKKNK